MNAALRMNDRIACAFALFVSGRNGSCHHTIWPGCQQDFH